MFIIPKETEPSVQICIVLLLLETAMGWYVASCASLGKGGHFSSRCKGKPLLKKGSHSSRCYWRCCNPSQFEVAVPLCGRFTYQLWSPVCKGAAFMHLQHPFTARASHLQWQKGILLHRGCAQKNLFGMGSETAPLPIFLSASLGTSQDWKRNELYRPSLVVCHTHACAWPWPPSLILPTTCVKSVGSVLGRADSLACHQCKYCWWASAATSLVLS